MEHEPLLQLGFYNNIHSYIHSWNKDFLSTSNGPDAVIGFEEAVVGKTFYLLFKGLDQGRERSKERIPEDCENQDASKY